MAVRLGDGRAHVVDERERGGGARLWPRRARPEKPALLARRGNQRERRQVEVAVNVLDRLERVVEVVEQEGEADADAEARAAAR